MTEWLYIAEVENEAGKVVHYKTMVCMQKVLPVGMTLQSLQTVGARQLLKKTIWLFSTNSSTSVSHRSCLSPKKSVRLAERKQTAWCANLVFMTETSRLL